MKIILILTTIHTTKKKEIESGMISSMKMNKRMNKKKQDQKLTAIKMVFSAVYIKNKTKHYN
jgi:hypothetical protein